MTDTNNQPQRTKRGLDPATAAELGDLLHELAGNKKTRSMIAKAIKEAAPESPHAAAFRDVEVEDRFEEFERKQEEKRIKDEQERLVTLQNQQRQKLIDGDERGRKYSEDDVKKIEDLMTKKGIWNYEDGATLYAATLPPADPKPHKDEPPPPGATWEFPRWSDYGKDPVTASRNEAHKIIGELMRKRA